MDDIDREYKYQPKWWTILYHAGVYTMGAVICGYTAWQGRLPVFYWVVCVLCIVLVAHDGEIALSRLMVSHRVALTRNGLILPKSGRWSSEEMVISYDDITGLFISSDELAPKLFREPIDLQVTTQLPMRKLKGARFLYVEYIDGERRIAAIGLPSHAAFEDFCGLLMSRVRVSQQVGHT
jgi:hypothetical protein